MAPDDAPIPIEPLLAHRAWLRTLAARLVGPWLADDLVQETWLAALRRPPDPARPARPWLATVARRLASRIARRNAPGSSGADPGAPDAPEPVDPRPSTAELLARVELETALAREVARLAEPFRRTVLLRYHAGLSAAEIARREHVPAGTVRWRLKRGLEELRDRLDARYGERETWAVAFAPLAALGAPGASAAAASSWGKVAGAAAVALALAGGGAWRLARPGGEGSQPADARAPAALVAAPEAAAQGGEAGGPESLVVGEPAEPAERRPAAAGSKDVPGAFGLRLRFVEWDGAPSADRLTAIRVAPDEVVSATTDERGAVAFPGASGRVVLAHDRAGAAPYVAELDATLEAEPTPDAIGPTSGELVIELPRGAEVSGRVLVDDRPPRPPLELVLFRSNRPEPLPLFDPDARAGDLVRGAVPITTTTDAEGRFRAVGLDAGWQGCIAFPRGYAPPERVGHGDPHERNTQFVARPTQGLEIALAMRPHVSGRIVESDGVTPVDFARVQALVTHADGTGMLIGAATDSGDGGRFTLFPEEWPLRRIALSIAGRDGRGSRDVVFEGERLPADADLGDIALAPGRALFVRVTDAVGGGPVEGARVRDSDTRSDARGELALAGITLDATELRIGAPGFSSQVVAAPPGAAEVAVALEPTTTLVVTAVGPDGKLLAELDVEMSADGPIFAGEPGSMPETLTSADLPGTWWTTKPTETGMIGRFRTNAQGRYVGQGFRSDTAFTLNARTTDGVPLAEAWIAPLRSGERRAVELFAPRVPRALAVRVVDEAGAPISRAQVRLGPAGEDVRKVGRSWSTDALGRATVPNLSGEPLWLEVDGADHLPFAIEPFRVPDDGEVVELVLREGLRLTVRVADAEGRPVTGGRLSHDAQAATGRFRETEAGRFEGHGVPDAPLELRLHLAGRVFRRTHDPRVAEARIVVPAPGAARVAWTTPAGADWGIWRQVVLVAVDPPPDPEAHEFGRSFADTPDGETTFEPVFPGTYRAELHHYRDDNSLEVLARSADFDVRAGETASATLRPVSGPDER